MFVNTSNADDKYSLRNTKKLPQPIQLQLSKKQKNFSQFFSAYLKSISNIEHFETKDEPHGLCIFTIRDCKICG